MPRYFISYRRDDAPGEAGRLADQLRARVGDERVFIDVDAIRAGDDFAQVIDRELANCSAMLVLIGRTWAQGVDAAGRCRLDDPQDFVRLEVETALRRNVRVVPVLVRGAVLPKPDVLPPALHPLLRRQAFELADTHFRSDVDRLIAALEGRRHRARWAGVAIAVLALALGGLVLDNRSPAAGKIIVRVHEPGGVDNVARIAGRVQLNGPDAAIRSRPLIDGEAIFDDLPGDAAGRSVEVSVDETTGFQSKSERHIVPESGILRVELAKVETTSVATGTVLDAHGQPLAGAVIDVDHGLISAETDQRGAFRIVVPRPPGSMVAVIVAFKGRVGFRENLTVPGPFTLQWAP